MSISLIVARAANNVIGKDNALIWHISDDLRLFKQRTMGRPIIMGRKTFESLPGLLPGRVHYVLTANEKYAAPIGIHLFHTKESLLSALPKGENFLIGGARMYRDFLLHADTMYITEIHKEYEGDAFFPSFDENEWIVTERIQGVGDIPHDFVTYKRKT